MSTVIASHKVIARAAITAYTAQGNKYGYADVDRQTYDVKITRTVHGAHYVTVSGIGSHIYSGLPFDNETDARADANRVFVHMRDAFVSQYGLGESGAPKHADPTATRPSQCSKCENFGTLETKMLPYGNQTDCSAEGCGYSNYFSIGD